MSSTIFRGTTHAENAMRELTVTDDGWRVRLVIRKPDGRITNSITFDLDMAG